MGANQVLIREIQARSGHTSGHHALRTIEEVLIVRTPRTAVAVNQSRLATAACTPTSPSVVRGSRWDLAKVV
jgi:hypothetical protein